MANTEPSAFSTETIVASIKEYGRSEFSMLYAYLVKNMRYVVLIAILLVVISTGAVLGLLLLFFGVMQLIGASANAMAVVAIVFGALGLGGAGLIVFTALSHKFWIKTFKLDEMVKDAAQKANARAAEKKYSQAINGAGVGP